MFVDLKGPRFNKRKFRKNIVNPDLYKAWKTRTEYDKDIALFKTIWNNIALKLISKVLTERDGVRLGSGLGDIYIGIVPKAKRRGIDYKISKELGKMIYHENWNTNGKLGKIIYAIMDRPYIYRLCHYWGFKPHRNFKKMVVKQLQDNPERYKTSIERKYYDTNKR